MYTDQRKCEAAIAHLMRAIEALKWQQVSVAKRQIAKASIAADEFELVLQAQED